MSERRPYERTNVSASQTQEQLDSLLQRRGVDVTRWTNTPDQIRFEFQHKGIGYRIDVPLPAGGDLREKDQLRRERARVLYWYVKSKLEAVEFGLGDLQREFLPYMLVGPDTVFFERVEEAIENGARSLPLGQDLPFLPSPRVEVIDVIEVSE